MKFKSKHIHGDTRTIEKFLWFPKKIDGEIRWLEFCFIKQTYNCSNSILESYWEDKYFLNIDKII